MLVIFGIDLMNKILGPLGKIEEIEATVVLLVRCPRLLQRLVECLSQRLIGLVVETSMHLLRNT